MEEQKSKMREVLESDLAKIVFIASIAVSIVLFIIVPQYNLKTQLSLLEQEINVIKNNELVHIKTQLEKNETDHEEIKENVIEMDKKLDLILYKLENNKF